MSVTTVPIQPIEKGSLLKLWGGVGLAALLAAGLAWYGTNSAGLGDCGDKAFVPEGKGTTAPLKTESGLRFQTVKAGAGAKPTNADVVLMNYRGSLAKTGFMFDESKQPTPMPVGGSIPGFSEALKIMQAGGTYRICIPGKLGYGAQGMPQGQIPPNATLLFQVELLAAMPMAEFQARMQSLQAQQGKGRGAPPMPPR
jgi:FKBP-type peptidyl-prolyl cis-trans isomerase FkpA